MKIAAIITLVAGTATAFAPASMPKRTTSLNVS